MKKLTQGTLVAMAAAAAFAVLPTLASADTTNATEVSGSNAQQMQGKAQNSCKGKKASGAKAKNSCHANKPSTGM